MDITSLLPLLVGLLLGLAIGLVIARVLHRSREQVAAAEQRVGEGAAQVELERLRAEADRARGEAASARSETHQGRTAVAEAERSAAEARGEVHAALAETARVQALLSGAEAARDAARARATEIAADREALADRFKTLSAETLELQGKQADASAEQRFKATEQLLAPVSEKLKEVSARLAEVEKERLRLATELQGQVQTVRATGEQMRREASSLATALRKPQVRGAWGEMQLKRVAEVSGMVEHCDFTTQHSTTADDHAIRPDMRVELAEGKYVFVDSKVPLAAFLEAQDAEDAAVREAAMQRFAQNVRTHVDQLSAKRYWTADAGTPEFVVLFLASEALAAEAFSVLPELHSYAAAKNIVLATPTTLIAMLRAVAYGWRQAALAENAAEVLQLGRELHDRLGNLGNHFDRVGRGLSTAVKAYNQTLGTLESRVMVSARRFRDLKVADAELDRYTPVDEPIRSLADAELVADAAAVEPIIGRRRRKPALAAGHEQDTIFDRDPETDELVQGELSTAEDDRRRSS